MSDRVIVPSGQLYPGAITTKVGGVVVPLGELYPNTVISTETSSDSTSQYPVWWEDTVTLYNRYEDAQTNVVVWHRTVLTNCFWKSVGSKVVIDDTTIDTDNLICRIPKDNRYLNPLDWKQLSNDVMDEYFTLKQNDIIVKGEVNDVINEYSKGYRANDLIEKYKDVGCFLIRKVGINVGTGKCDEHYYISGD